MDGKMDAISLLAEAGVTKKHGSVTVVIESIIISAFHLSKTPRPKLRYLFSGVVGWCDGAG